MAKSAGEGGRVKMERAGVHGGCPYVLSDLNSLTWMAPGIGLNVITIAAKKTLAWHVMDCMTFSVICLCSFLSK